MILGVRLRLNGTDDWNPLYVRVYDITGARRHFDCDFVLSAAGEQNWCTFNADVSAALDKS